MVTVEIDQVRSAGMFAACHRASACALLLEHSQMMPFYCRRCLSSLSCSNGFTDEPGHVAYHRPMMFNDLKRVEPPIIKQMSASAGQT